MKLAEYFNALCDEHDLTGISVNGDRFSGSLSFTAYAHWKSEPHRCAAAYGDTPEEAMAKAVAEANARRGRGIVIPDALEVEQAAWDDGYTVGVASDEGEPIAVLEIVDHGDMADPAQLRADQALVAAAPELLAALKHLVTIEQGLPQQWFPPAIMRDALAAIAKAGATHA